MFHSKGIPRSNKDPIRKKHIRMSRAYRPGARIRHQHSGYYKRTKQSTLIVSSYQEIILQLPHPPVFLSIIQTKEEIHGKKEATKRKKTRRH